MKWFTMIDYAYLCLTYSTAENTRRIRISSVHFVNKQRGKHAHFAVFPLLIVAKRGNTFVQAGYLSAHTQLSCVVRRSNVDESCVTTLERTRKFHRNPGFILVGVTNQIIFEELWS